MRPGLGGNRASTDQSGASAEIYEREDHLVMDMGMGAMMGAWMVLWTLLAIALLVLIVVATVWLLKNLTPRHNRTGRWPDEGSRVSDLPRGD